MVLEAREMIKSDDARRESLSDVTRTRVFRVFDTLGAQITTTEAFSAPGLPVLGDVHPTLFTLFATRNTAERVEGHNDLIEIRWEYIPPGLVPPNSDATPAGTSFDVDFRTEFRSIYRDNPFATGLDPSTIGFGADVTSGTLFTDIGGISKDVSGYAMPRNFVQETLVITETVNGVPPFTLYASVAGRRNQGNFYGATQGQVLYLPGSSSQVADNIYRVTHRFVSDPFFHLVQVPARYQDSGPEGGDVIPGHRLGVPVGFTVAVEVYWRQPYTGLFPFNLLSPNF